MTFNMATRWVYMHREWLKAIPRGIGRSSVRLRDQAEGALDAIAETTTLTGCSVRTREAFVRVVLDLREAYGVERLEAVP